ncbi:MAG: hypothetical protein RR573_07820 [Oscillospiraceae bacterium]
MKKIICILLLIICLIPHIFAAKTEYDNNAQISLPYEWQQLFDDAPITQDEFKKANLQTIITKAINIVKAKLTQPLKILAQITALLLFAAIARNMCPTTLGGNMYNIIDTVVSLAIFSLCAVPMLDLIHKMSCAIEESRLYISSFIPVFTSIMISCGEVGSAAIYGGIFFSVVMLIANILCKYALPGLRIFLALGIIGSINDNIDFCKIADGFSKCAKWLLTICATAFAAVLGLQSALAQSADSLALKAGKLLVSASVPVIGRAVSDTIGSVYTGLKLLKGTAAIALVGMLAISFVPLLAEGIAYYFVLLISSVIAKGLGSEKNSRLFDCILNTISLSMLFIFFFAMMALVATIMMVLMGGG